MDPVDSQIWKLPKVDGYLKLGYANDGEALPIYILQGKHGNRLNMLQLQKLMQLTAF